MKRGCLLAIVIGSGLSCLIPARAMGDMAIYDARLIENPTLIDFDSLSLGSIDDPDVLISEGITFGDTAGLTALSGALFGLPADNVVIDFEPADGVGSVEILFSTSVEAVGVDYDERPHFFRMSRRVRERVSPSHRQAYEQKVLKPDLANDRMYVVLLSFRRIVPVGSPIAVAVPSLVEDDDAKAIGK